MLQPDNLQLVSCRLTKMKPSTNPPTQQQQLLLKTLHKDHFISVE